MISTKPIGILSQPVKVEKSSLFLETLQRMLKSPGAKVGTILFAVIILLSIFAPLIAPYKPNDMDLKHMFSAPSAVHWMGTDGLGRDQLTRMLYGGQYSLALGVTASLFGAIAGVFIGSFAGYFGGRTETLIMRLMDIWSSIPGMLLCILISAVLGRGFFNTVLALSIGGVPECARYIRAQILRERSKEYLEAAEAINCSKLSIMFRHLLPNVVQPVLVNVTMGIGMVITMGAALSYIGLGVQPPIPEWGALLAAGRSHILNYPYLIMFPGLVIAVTVLAVNLMGDGLRDALDPKLRS
jgi:ABC-type dipeptide/oligopeptide/nickel transport system permease subunit